MDAEFDSCDGIKQHYASDLLYPGAGLKTLSQNPRKQRHFYEYTINQSQQSADIFGPTSY